LYMINYYSSDGVKQTSIQYVYHNQPLIDNNPINPEEAFLDRYLPIFGTFSKHLTHRVRPLNKPNFINTTIEYQFTYAVNVFGMVILRNKYKLDKTTEPLTITLAEAAKYEYVKK
jgi:hypothetical protein